MLSIVLCLCDSSWNLNHIEITAMILVRHTKRIVWPKSEKSKNPSDLSPRCNTQESIWPWYAVYIWPTQFHVVTLKLNHIEIIDMIFVRHTKILLEKHENQVFILFDESSPRFHYQTKKKLYHAKCQGRNDSHHCLMRFLKKSQSHWDNCYDFGLAHNLHENPVNKEWKIKPFIWFEASCSLTTKRNIV